MKGQKLKEARMNKKMSQAKLAELLNVSGNTVYRWEKNMVEPPDDTKEALSSVLGVPVAYLMGEDTLPSDEAAAKAERLAAREEARQKKYNEGFLNGEEILKKTAQFVDDVKRAYMDTDDIEAVRVMLRKVEKSLAAKEAALTESEQEQTEKEPDLVLTPDNVGRYLGEKSADIWPSLFDSCEAEATTA